MYVLRLFDSRKKIFQLGINEIEKTNFKSCFQHDPAKLAIISQHKGNNEELVAVYKKGKEWDQVRLKK